MSKRATYLLIALICLIPVIVLGTTGIPVLTNVEPDGDVTLADGKHLSTNQVRARDAGGLGLYEDGGTAGILIDDAGAVTLTELGDGLVKSVSGTPATAEAGVDYITTAADLILGDGYYFAADSLRARDADGLRLYEDGGTMGIEVSDTGAVTLTELATGLVKSTDGLLSGASAGTDFLSPSMNATLDDALFFAADEVRARDSGGLTLSDDSGNAAIHLPDGGGADVLLNPAPGTDDTGNGVKAAMTIDSGATVAVGDCLHMDTDGEWVESSASAMATMPCAAMALEAGTGPRKILLKGFMRHDGWNWTPGEILYASTTTGELTATAPSGSGEVVQVVGFATNADRIFFNPEYDRIEVQ